MSLAEDEDLAGAVWQLLDGRVERGPQVIGIEPLIDVGRQRLIVVGLIRRCALRNALVLQVIKRAVRAA